MGDDNQIFIENELEANVYTARCLLWSAVIVVLTWILTYLGVFLTDITIMSVSGTLALLFLLIPWIIQRWRPPSHTAWKYVVILSFVFGIGVLSAALSMHLIPAWSCPILVACHYYTPRFTRHTFIFVHIAMLVSFIISIYVGVWDSNIFKSVDQVFGVQERLDFIQLQAELGVNVYQRGFTLFYLPRAAIISVVYLTSTALSARSHGLILRSKEMERAHQALETELNVATDIQASMLPTIFPAFPGRPEFDIYASMTPAKEVGGDFYDFFLVDDDHLAMVMADVSGKGVPAALFMVISKTLIKNAAQLGLSPKEVLEKVNNQLCEGNDAQMFVTVWLGIYQISTGQLTAANAGHEYPAIRRVGEDFQLYRDKHGFVLAGMDDLKYTEYTLQLCPGDTLYVYTDGIPEATSEAVELYGTDRMLVALNQWKDASLPNLLQGVKDHVDAFVGNAPQFDDLTMLAFQIKSVGQSPLPEG